MIRATEIRIMIHQTGIKDTKEDLDRRVATAHRNVPTTIKIGTTTHSKEIHMEREKVLHGNAAQG